MDKNKELLQVAVPPWVSEHIGKIFIGAILSLLFTLIGSFVTLYLSYKLTPFKETDQVIITRVDALRLQVIKNTDNVERLILNTAKIEDLDKRTLRIEDKIDTLNSYFIHY